MNATSLSSFKSELTKIALSTQSMVEAAAHGAHQIARLRVAIEQSVRKVKKLEARKIIDESDGIYGPILRMWDNNGRPVEGLRDITKNILNQRRVLKQGLS